MVPTLWRLGVRRLRLVVGTHPHHDHLGGLPAVLRRLPTEEVWLPSGTGRPHPDVAAIRQACQDTGSRLRRVGAGLVRRFGGVRLEVLHPPAPAGVAEANSRSLVLRVHWRRRCLWLTGDAGVPEEMELEDAGSVESCDVLKVGHHGSRSATGVRLVTSLRPRLALISVGEGNRWRHPDPEVLHRLTESGATVLRTDRHGQISVETDGRWLRWSTHGIPAR